MQKGKGVNRISDWWINGGHVMDKGVGGPKTPQKMKVEESSYHTIDEVLFDHETE